MSVARIGHVAMPLLGVGNRPSSAWCIRPGRPWSVEIPRWEQPGGQASVGARTLVNDCSLEITAPCRSCRRENLVRRARFHWGEADVCWEESGECTSRAPRGMGPSAYTKIAEITPGRSDLQQGLAATCEDHEDERERS